MNITSTDSHNIRVQTIPGFNLTKGLLSARDVTGDLCISLRTQATMNSSEVDATVPHTPNDTTLSPCVSWGLTTDANEVVMPLSEDVLLLQRIASSIDFWVSPFLFFIGTFTNTLVILVMRGRHFRHMSTSFYMAVSAVFDTIFLLVPLPPHYLYVNFPHIFDSIRHLHVICSICHMSGWVCNNLAVFLTVAMTVDRSLAIQFPLKAPTLCTVRRAKIVTLCLLLLEILVEGHVAFTSRLVPKGVKAYLCAIDRYFSDDYRVFHDYYWPNIHNVSLMLSFIAIIIGNAIIIKHVKRSEDSKDMGEGAKTAGGAQKGKGTSMSSQLSIMLIIDSASVITCTMPLTIYMMLDQSFQSTQSLKKNPYDLAKQDLAFAISFYLIQVNHCTNFFLYCISGARFRKALREVLLLGKSRQKGSHSSVSSTNVTSVPLGSQLGKT